MSRPAEAVSQSILRLFHLPEGTGPQPFEGSLIREYATKIFIPIVTQHPRETKLALYGDLKSIYKDLLAIAVPRERKSFTRSTPLHQMVLSVSGFLFLLTSFLKKDFKLMRIWAPCVPFCWLQALYEDGDLTDALQQMAGLLIRATFPTEFPGPPVGMGAFPAQFPCPPVGMGKALGVHLRCGVLGRVAFATPTFQVLLYHANSQ